MYQKFINIIKKWSHLTKLEPEHLNACIELQDIMSKRMKNKAHTFNYVSKKTKSDFERLIKNGELFGVFDNKDALVGIVSIRQQNTEQFLESLKYMDKNFSVSAELLNFLRLRNFYCLSDWMSDLSPRNVGVGKYMVNEVMKYLKKVLKADFSLAVIELNNSLSYKLLSKSNLSFAFAHRIIDFKNINGFHVKIPSISIVSLLNKKMVKNFYNSLDLKTIRNFKYTKNILKSIFSSNRQYDPVLEKDELIIIFRRKIRKIKFNPDKLIY